MGRKEVFIPVQTSIQGEGGIPLSFVPMPHRRGEVSSDALHTAGHELNHAIVARELGLPIVGISVVPSGDSLGRTVLGGLCSIDSIKIVAAAGSLATHDGSAHGYGSDMHKVDMLAHHYGGIQRGEAVNTASSILGKYSLEIRKKAAEILAYMRQAPGSMISAILERAHFEVQYEKGGHVQSFSNFSKPEPESNQKREFTVIDNLPNDQYRIRYVIDGYVRKEEYICGACQGVNGHSGDCPVFSLPWI